MAHLQQPEGRNARGRNRLWNSTPCFSNSGSWIREMPSVLLGIPWPALRGPLRNHFWKKRRPQPYWGGENSGNALEASNALNYRVWGIPAVLSREIPGNALRAFPGSFRNFSGISSRKSQPYWGCGPLEASSQAPLRALERLSGPRGGSSGALGVCSFSIAILVLPAISSTKNHGGDKRAVS